MIPKTKNKNKPKPKMEEEVEISIEKLKIVNNQILVAPVKVKQTSGLVKPEQYEDKPEFGRVLRVGDKIEGVKEGDIILFGKWSTLKLTINGKDYLIMRGDDLVGIHS